MATVHGDLSALQFCQFPTDVESETGAAVVDVCFGSGLEEALEEEGFFFVCETASGVGDGEAEEEGFAFRRWWGGIRGGDLGGIIDVGAVC